MKSEIKAIRPHTKHPNPAYFCRLFPPSLDPPFDECMVDRLDCLAESMRGDPDHPIVPPDDPNAKRHPQIPAGYTYFGQFIDHDLLKENVRGLPRPGCPVDPEMIVNHRKSFLQLDNIYGHPPHPNSKRRYFNGDGYFKLGATAESDMPFDVPVKGITPVVADDRNVENAIVRQVHAMFLLLHNKAMELKNGDFEEAQRLVRHQFQFLVLKDFLPMICNDEIGKIVHSIASGADPNSLIDWRGGFAIPVEFAHAAFRFGHSLVKNRYILHAFSNVFLPQLFGPTGALDRKIFAIDWPSFLTEISSSRLSLESLETADTIDTAITAALFELPHHSIAVFMDLNEVNALEFAKDVWEPRLPYRTLLRGAASQLCSGQEAAHKVCPKSTLTIPPASGTPDPFPPLRDCCLENSIPLWYYILLEAQLREAGRRLGALGSFIVAGTIIGALWSNPSSYVHSDDFKNNQEPPKDWGPLRTLLDVAQFVGLAPKTPCV